MLMACSIHAAHSTIMTQFSLRSLCKRFAASLWHNLQKQGRPQAAREMHKIEEAQTPFPPLLRDMVWNGQDLGAGMQFPLRAGELDIHLLFTSRL